MLSTIHKAKGLEADRVFLLEPKLIPSKFAEKKWQKEQEQKLLFVAYSRPRMELIFINNYLEENEK
jgi:superfamily I DNA/RNA helicase